MLVTEDGLIAFVEFMKHQRKKDGNIYSFNTIKTFLAGVSDLALRQKSEGLIDKEVTVRSKFVNIAMSNVQREKERQPGMHLNDILASAENSTYSVDEYMKMIRYYHERGTCNSQFTLILLSK